MYEVIIMNFDYIKNKRILLVDDEPELLSMVETILKGEGYLQQKTAKTVKEAIALWKEWQPEFAVLDVMLPDGDGFPSYNRSGLFRIFRSYF